MVISPAPEKVFEIGSFEVTNSLFSAVLIVLSLGLVFFLIGRKIKPFKPGKTQLIFEMLLGGFRDMADSIVGQTSNTVFSFLLTFLIFIIISNWFGLLPIVGNIGFEHKAEHTAEAEVGDEEHVSEHAEENEDGDETSLKAHEESEEYVGKTEEHAEEVAEKDEEHGAAHVDEPITFGSCLKNRDCVLTTNFKLERFHEMVPLFRAPTSDVSATAALAIVSVIFANAVGYSVHKLGHFKKYINFSGPIEFFVGILELISELGKIMSFTFRLFGNIFAGEVLLLVVTSISYGLATLPFMGLEIFVGFIQAFVFFMLTAVFIGVNLSSHH